MHETILFGAPWDQKLRVITGLVTALLIATTVFLAWAALTRVPFWPIRLLMLIYTLVPLGVLVAGAMMGPVGYAVHDDGLRVERRWFPVDIPREEIRGAELLPPERLAGTWRTLGTGGFFGYYGQFRNRDLGSFRMYATRSDGYVLVKASRFWVVTPDSPQRFVEAINRISADNDARADRQTP